jgi:hypothetical protein
MMHTVVVRREFLILARFGSMKPLLRPLLAPVAVVALAGVLAWLFIQREDRQAGLSAAKDQVAAKENILALRIAAIDEAQKIYQVMLETERIAFEREKQEAEFAELAELSHEVRLLRIDLEHKTTLAAIDKKYPPAHPLPPDRPPAP